MPKNKYSDWTHEELIEEIKKLKRHKKYGLIWEEKPEDVVEQCKKELPVLEEVKDKAIEKDQKLPTNLLIEGDNYHALSVLNYTHAGKIDVIYIDPPYNTGKGKEWKYNDKWVDENDTYSHSKWLSFLSKRLLLAEKLLSTSGVIFISIDDNEYHNLKILCDDIFGEKKYIATLVWEKKKKGSHLSEKITNVKEYILVYRKNDKFEGLIGQITNNKETYPCINPGNGFSTRIIPSGVKSNYLQPDISLPTGYEISAGNMKLVLKSDLEIKNKILVKDVLIEAEWRYQQSVINKFAKLGTLYFTRDLYLRNIVTETRKKKLKDILSRVAHAELIDLYEELTDLISNNGNNTEEVYEKLKAINAFVENKSNLDNLMNDGWGSNEDADNEQRDFFGMKVFDYPKPTKLIKKLIASTRKNNAIILDFFAGTGTTGQAVLEINNELHSNLKFILCTNNEDNDDNGMNIAEDICYVRLKKVINGYKKRNGTQVEGINSNLKYLKTAFVKTSPVTDDTRRELVKKSTEMICVRENTYDIVIDKPEFKLYQDSIHATGILFNLDTLIEFKQEITKQALPVNIYVFSLTNDTYTEDFADLLVDHTLCPIPESILEVYQKIFK